MLLIRLTVILVTSLVFIASASAYEKTSFRCGNGLVEIGMDIKQIKKSCGRKWLPDEIRTKVQNYKTPRDIAFFIKDLPPTANTYQYWLYRNYGKFDIWLTLRNGVIQYIGEGERAGQ